MSFSKQVSPTTQTSLTSPAKATSLNPNAAEFVPFSLRTPSSGTTSNIDVAAKFPASGSSGKQVLDRSESSISTNSDEEARQYWQQQLPDDITPDFNVLGEDDHHGLGSLSLAALSLHAGGSATDAIRFSGSLGSPYKMNETLEFTAHHTNGAALSDKMGYPISAYGDDPSSTSYLQRTSKPWEMQLLSADHHFGNARDGNSFDETTRRTNPNDIATETSMLENNDMNPVEFLVSQFPGFAAESLAEVYFANGCDLNLTVEMLTQLELQVDGAFNQNMNLKTLSAPNLTSMDFPALPVPDNKTNLQKYTGDELQQNVNSYGSSEKDNLLLFRSNSSLSAKGATDFASAVRKLSPQDPCLWKYDRSGSADIAVGSSRNSHALSGSYHTGAGRSAYSDRMQGRSSARAAPVWLETGEAVGNLYTEVREEARDHARIRNVYFEQARQAYLMGNKALAKELSVNGQLHNMKMKAAHSKAQESIYRQRNPISPDQQGGGRCQGKVIDLHGLHVSEAIHVLKQELSVLRNAARLAEQRLHVYICVGTGHHTRGSRTPARLPIAVQRYLLEDEGLEFSEPQQGMLRVVLY
ncbi:polyadenylate-binding protein-interacting protein 7-like [Chenopodium quinoa]|uniref:polyadenylate-binding protein-interacting protein 7-like n=1 Tax=Chenopodium quinoa TaxID=63459 RepID=UPI000B7851A5|nr:polyadenylate-binding protein-interacting protein 7-like [Chenopodium quinoa]